MAVCRLMLTVTSRLTAQQLPTAGPLSNRNLIINGAMEIAQRGTSTDITVGNYTGFSVDRFKHHIQTGQMVGTLERAYDESTGVSGLPFSLKWTTTTAETSVDAADLFYIAQYVEGFNGIAPKFGTSDAQPTTISFWVKCSIAGTYAFSIYRADSVRNIVKTYTINAADTWEYKTITFPADTTGTVTPNNDEGLRLNWHLMAGSNYTGTDASSWGAYTGTRWVGSGVINNDIATTANATWEITGVQYEVGSKSTPFEHQSYGQTLAKCQRYYFRSDLGSTAGVNGFFGMPIVTATSICIGSATFPVTMRQAPDVELPFGYDQSGVVSGGTATAGVIGVNGFIRINKPSGSFSTNGTPVSALFTASAEL
jgi:hypothetical protein